MVLLQHALFFLCLVAIGWLGRHSWWRCRRDGNSLVCSHLFATEVVSIGIFLLLFVTPDLFPTIAISTQIGITALILSLIVGLITTIALQVVDRS